jgi:ADP-heptose:LPS heptosyltransferase
VTPRLVVLRALGLGDALTAVPALRALAAAFPQHRKVVAMPAPLAPLLGLARLPFDVCDVRGLAPQPVVLRDADVAVNLHGRGPQSHRRLCAAQPRRLVAFACAAAGLTDGPRWRPGEHEVARWCRMLTESRIPADPTALEIDAPPPGPLAHPGATVVHPGAASAARRWPWRRWAAVAARERAAGRDVLVTGAAEELSLARAVAREAGLPPSAVLAGRTDLVELTGVVAAAARVLCGDTGIAHLATALGRPSVVLFGPVAPMEWGPPQDRPLHRALWAGRRGDPHGQRVDAGLLQIDVDDVLDALERLPDLVAAR